MTTHALRQGLVPHDEAAMPRLFTFLPDGGRPDEPSTSGAFKRLPPKGSLPSSDRQPQVDC